MHNSDLPLSDSVHRCERSYVHSWLTHEPQLRLARLFMPVLNHPVIEVLVCLEYEWLSTVFSVRDAQVAQRKLTWWLSELKEDQPTHPLMQALHRLGVRDDLQSALAQALSASLCLASTESIQCIDMLLRGIESILAPIAKARAQVLKTLPMHHSILRAAAAAALTYQLKKWSRFAEPVRGWIPLDLLLSEGLSRPQMISNEACYANQKLNVVEKMLLLLQNSLFENLESELQGVEGVQIIIARIHNAYLKKNPQCVIGGTYAFSLWRCIVPLWRLGMAEPANLKNI